MEGKLARRLAAIAAVAAVAGCAPQPGRTPADGRTPGASGSASTGSESPDPSKSPEVGQNNHEGLTRVGDSLYVKGVPTSVDRKNVDTADGKNVDGFQNDLGDGTQMMFAEPGKLNVERGSFPQSKVDASRGAIQYLSELNHELLTDETTPLPLPEGGFAMISTNGATVEIGDYVIRMDSVPNTNWLFFVRGQYGDGAQNTDKNKKMVVTVDHPGFGEYQNFSGVPNGGFISEGQLDQLMKTSHSGGTNCGDGGCTDLNIVMFDVNTGALVMVKQVAGQNQSNFDVTPVYSNWS